MSYNYKQLRNHQLNLIKTKESRYLRSLQYAKDYLSIVDDSVISMTLKLIKQNEPCDMVDLSDKILKEHLASDEIHKEAKKVVDEVIICLHITGEILCIDDGSSNFPFIVDDGE